MMILEVAAYIEVGSKRFESLAYFKLGSEGVERDSGVFWLGVALGDSVRRAMERNFTHFEYDLTVFDTEKDGTIPKGWTVREVPRSATQIFAWHPMSDTQQRMKGVQNG